MKKLVSIALIMVWALSLCTGVFAEAVKALEVKKAFSGQLFSSIPQYDNLLDIKTKQGEALRSTVNKELIYRFYDVRTETGNIEFLNYKKGDDFTKYLENYFTWVFPVTKEDGTIQEYSCVVEDSGVPSIDEFEYVKDLNKSYGIYLNYDRMAQIIGDTNIGMPSTIIAGHSYSPVSSLFIYIKTNKGQYIIPFASKLQFYNKYHDDKIELINYKAYTTDEYVEIIRKERQGWVEYTKAMAEKQQSKDATYKDENGDTITPTPTPSSSSTPTVTPMPTVEPTSTPPTTPALTSAPSPIINGEINVEEIAAELYDLGLFKGTENGYDLDSTLTRAQGATMLVRLIEKESAALLSSAGSGFDDVPNESHWAAPYIGYCARNGMIKGTSETTFTPDKEMTAQEFLTIVIRATGKADVSLETAFDIGKQLDLISNDDIIKLKTKNNFTRDDMIVIAYNYYTKYLIDK